jgi:hypothetical protein
MQNLILDTTQLSYYLKRKRKFPVDLPCFKSSIVKCFRVSYVFGQTKSTAVS